MAGNVKWVEPFQTSHARTDDGLRRGRSAMRGSLHFRFQFVGERFGAQTRVRCVTYANDILPYVIERMGSERQHAWRTREAGQRRREILWRRSAHVAKILGYDQVRREGREQVSVNGVNTLAARDEFADLAVDFRGRSTGIHAWPDQRRLASCIGRKITFVRDADDLVANAERVENFSRGRKQRDDSHGFMLAQTRAVWATRDDSNLFNRKSNISRAAHGIARGRRPNWR